ncbi:MAG TPA: sigma-70 family RNA polymerase sigma factor [Polyangia bacterium]|jgi:RNA polymerase sigma-70 factor (ECF subfamily)|nr:sigma-70 family RNA polymerase sigma factor [Polyangia bacterium]
MPFFRGRADRLQAFRAGERSVVEEVYWSYLPLVEKIVRHGVRQTIASGTSPVPASDVADAVQEVFARAFRERARLAYDGIRDYGPFLTTIARNVVADWGRRRGHAVVEIAVDLDNLPSPMGEQNWAEEAVMQIVERYISELPPELRRVHELRYTLAQSQNDAAQALGVSRQRLRTLEEKLRRGLERGLRRAGLAGRVK